MNRREFLGLTIGAIAFGASNFKIPEQHADEAPFPERRPAITGYSAITGEETVIYAPDPRCFNKFVEVGRIVKR